MQLQRKSPMIFFMICSFLTLTLYGMDCWFDPETFCKDVNTLLIQAIQQNNIVEATRLLQEERVDPNKRNTVGLTPLSFTTNGWVSIELMKLLLKEGANPNNIIYESSKDGIKELDGAITGGTEEKIKLLLQSGADPFAIKKAYKKPDPIFNEQQNKNIEVVQAERTERKKLFFTYLLCQERARLLPTDMRKAIFDFL